MSLNDLKHLLSQPSGRWVALVAFCLLLLVAAPLLLYQRWTGLLKDTETRLARVQELAAGTPESFDSGKLLGVCADVAQAKANLETIRRETRPLSPVLFAFQLMPWVKSEWREAPQLLDLAIHLTRAGDTSCRAVQPVLLILEEPSSRISMGHLAGTLAQGLRSAQADLQEAKRELELASQGLDGLKTMQFSGKLGGLLAALVKRLPQFQTALDVALQAPDFMEMLLGMKEPQTYLVLMLNRDDLRGAGGFITAAAMVTVKGGEVQVIDLRNSISWNDPTFWRADPVNPGSTDEKALMPAPKPMEAYVSFKAWFFQDANWSPGFPTSAEKAVSFLASSIRPSVDGVIALDQTVLQEMLRNVGSVQLNEFNETVDASNIMQRIEYYTHGKGAQQGSGLDPKLFLRILFEELLERFSQASAKEWVGMSSAVLTGLEEKHVLLYFRNSHFQSSIKALGWSGEIRSSPGDYLIVTDTNLSYSKLVSDVKRSLRLEVIIGKDLEVQQNRLTITYENTRRPVKDFPCVSSYPIAMEGPCLKDWVRIYLPRGSALKSAEGFDEAFQSYEDAGKQVYAGFLIMNGGESKTVQLTYTPPKGTVTPAKRSYELLLQKQSGTDAIPLDLTVSLLALPILLVQPGSSSPEPDFHRTTTTLLTDLRITVPLQ